MPCRLTRTLPIPTTYWNLVPGVQGDLAGGVPVPIMARGILGASAPGSCPQGVVPFAPCGRLGGLRILAARAALW